jgi:hypothetical protein
VYVDIFQFSGRHLSILYWSGVYGY